MNEFVRPNFHSHPMNGYTMSSILRAAQRLVTADGTTHTVVHACVSILTVCVCVLVGHDIETETDAAQGSLGICPQHGESSIVPDRVVLSSQATRTQ